MPTVETKPIIGLEAIHRKYFVAEDGTEILSISALQKMSKEMQDAKVCARVPFRKKGRTHVRIVALEPFFSLWRREKLCRMMKKP